MNSDEPWGLLTFNQNRCEYELILTYLEPNETYEWKITSNGKDWYGCKIGTKENENCKFETDECLFQDPILRQISPSF